MGVDFNAAGATTTRPAHDDDNAAAHGGAQAANGAQEVKA
jgi:hypothetical protein